LQHLGAACRVGIQRGTLGHGGQRARVGAPCGGSVRLASRAVAPWRRESEGRRRLASPRARAHRQPAARDNSR
jgi:hypothetical protein